MKLFILIKKNLFYFIFVDVYQWADSSGKMIIRVCLFFPIETWPRLVVRYNRENLSSISFILFAIT